MGAKRRAAAIEGIDEFRQRLREPDWFNPQYMPVGRHHVSDERVKQGLAPASAADATAEVASFKYDYKPEAVSMGFGAPGQNYGVSAQQVEKTSLGPSLVREGADGLKRIDIGSAATTALAATGELSRKIQHLEQSLGQGGTTPGGVPSRGGVPMGHGSRPQQPSMQQPAAPPAAPGVDLDPRVPWSYSDRVRAKAAAELANGAPPGFRGLERREDAARRVAERTAREGGSFDDMAMARRRMAARAGTVDGGARYAPPRTSTTPQPPARPPSWEAIAERATTRPAPELPAGDPTPQRLPSVERDLGPVPRDRRVAANIYPRLPTRSNTGQSVPASTPRATPVSSGQGDAMSRPLPNTATTGKYEAPEPLTQQQQDVWDAFWDEQRSRSMLVRQAPGVDESGRRIADADGPIAEEVEVTEGGLPIPKPWRPWTGMRDAERILPRDRVDAREKIRSGQYVPPKEDVASRRKKKREDAKLEATLRKVAGSPAMKESQAREEQKALEEYERRLAEIRKANKESATEFDKQMQGRRVNRDMI